MPSTLKSKVTLLIRSWQILELFRSHISYNTLPTAQGQRSRHMATRWGLTTGVWTQSGARHLCSSKRPNWILGTSSLLLSGFQKSFPDVKWHARNATHLTAHSNEPKNEWTYTSATPICLHGVNRGNFTYSIIHHNSIKFSVVKDVL